MRRELIICDVCGRETEEIRPSPENRLVVSSIRIEEYNKGMTHKRDLCFNCQDLILELFICLRGKQDGGKEKDNRG